MCSASLAGPKLKLERAECHIGYLETARERFFETDPYEVRGKDDQEAGMRCHVVTRADKVPRPISLIAGDAIHCLRSALDHLIWQLIIANDRDPKDMRSAFPVWKSQAAFESSRPGDAKGISATAIDVLYALKPYQGGNDALWRLHQLDIVDKHRLLLAVGTAYQAPILDLGTLANQLFGKSGSDAWGSMPVAINPAERFILKKDACLFSFPLGEQMDEHVKFAFDVALNEPEVPQGEPIVVTLNNLASVVDEVFNLFAPLIGE